MDRFVGGVGTRVWGLKNGGTPGTYGSGVSIGHE
jgi:hypothetical protein